MGAMAIKHGLPRSTCMAALLPREKDCEYYLTASKDQDGFFNQKPYMKWQNNEKYDICE